MSRTAELSNLDFMRAFAVMCVWAAHFTRTIGVEHGMAAVGFMGVLIFFVHTSLVLMFSMERLRMSGGKLALTFYVRRAFRIYPLSVCCVLLVWFWNIPPSTWGEIVPPLTTRDLIANIALIQNIVGGHSVLVPLWSLPYEIQMYALLPAIFLYACRTTSVRRIAVLWIIGVVLALLQDRYVPAADLALYVPCFLPGILAYQLRKRITPSLPAWLWLFFVPGVLFLYVALTRVHSLQYWPRWICALLLGLCLPRFRDLQSRPITWLSHQIAKYSYGIYLGHQIILWLWQDHYLSVAGLVVANIVVPLIVYHLIEDPMVQLGKRLTAKRRLAVTAAATS